MVLSPGDRQVPGGPHVHLPDRRRTRHGGRHERRHCDRRRLLLGHRGSQNTSAAFGELRDQIGVTQSVGTTGVCWACAAAEASFRTCNCSVVTRATARRIVMPAGMTIRSARGELRHGSGQSIIQKLERGEAVGVPTPPTVTQRVGGSDLRRVDGILSTGGRV